MKNGFDILIIMLLAFTRPAAAAEWALAGREGECAPVTGLEKRGPEFHGVESPMQLVDKMRAAGEKVEIKEYKAGSRPAVEVRVPGRNLYVMFVKSDLCAKKAPSVEPPAKSKGR